MLDFESPNIATLLRIVLAVVLAPATGRSSSPPCSAWRSSCGSGGSVSVAWADELPWLVLFPADIYGGGRSIGDPARLPFIALAAVVSARDRLAVITVGAGLFLAVSFASFGYFSSPARRRLCLWTRRWWPLLVWPRTIRADGSAQLSSAFCDPSGFVSIVHTGKLPPARCDFSVKLGKRRRFKGGDCISVKVSLWGELGQRRRSTALRPSAQWVICSCWFSTTSAFANNSRCARPIHPRAVRWVSRPAP
jgi:hypothetical protein